MTPYYNQSGSKAKYAIIALLLVNTALAGGSLAWAGTVVAKSEASHDQKSAEMIIPASGNPGFTQAGFADLVSKVKPAVVNIATTELAQKARMRDMPDVPPGWPFGDSFRQFFEHKGAQPQHALGSGFIVDPTGYIVTNNHVVDGAHKISVTLDDGNVYQAKVVGRDPKTDLAVLKIDAGKPLPYVAFGDSDKARVGDWVVAVGNPFGLGGSVTAGIVSAHGRSLNNGPYDNFMQIDAPINQGNSGGPLFNQAGQVIGIDTAIYSPNGGSVGIGFAVPSSIASKVVAELREHGKIDRGWLGVQMQPMTPALAKAIGLSEKDGVLVNSVVADSPAAKAQIKQGDVILSFNGTAIKEPRDLAFAVANARAGQPAKVTVWRDGQKHTKTAVIDAQKVEKAASKTEGTEEGPAGMTLGSLSDENRSELGLGPSARGVVVEDVASGSRADESGVQPGDVIVRIGNDSISTPAEAVDSIHKAEKTKKEAVPLLVTRNGTTYYLALQLAQG